MIQWSDRKVFVSNRREIFSLKFDKNYFMVLDILIPLDAYFAKNQMKLTLQSCLLDMIQI